MATAGISEEIASTASARSQALIHHYERCTRNGRGAPGDTLHCKSHARGSAAQFNQSVSAMPSYDSRNFDCPSGQGTADTLSKRWKTA
jgi:hypothetical protein